ncbi:MAG: P83/100 family protein [Spirochaetota bacterium]
MKQILYKFPLNMALIFLNMLVPTLLLAQTNTKLGEREIKKANSAFFQNRSVRRASLSTIRNNRSLGKKLAELAQKNSKQTGFAEDFAIRRILPKDDKQFGADIITPDKSSRYGHINSLIRILASYLQTSFRYSYKNSVLLSKYILYYNAFHRKNVAYIQEKYASSVEQTVDREKIGIASHYKKWAGNSQIIIPLEKNANGQAGIPTDEIEKEANKYASSSEKEKFDTLKDELERAQKTDKSSDNKQGTKENDQTTANLSDDTDKKAPSSTKDTDKDTTDTGNTANDLALLDKQKDKRQQPPTEENPLQKENKSLKQQNKNLEKQKEGIEKENKDLKNENKKLNRVTEILKGQKQDLRTAKDRSDSDNKKLRNIIADKKQKEYERNETSRNVMDGKIVFLRILSRFPTGSNFNNEIYLIDPEKDDAVVKSEYRNICSKKFEEFGQHVLLLGCDKKSHKLVLLNLRKSLKKEFESKQSVYRDTPLIIDKNRNVLFAFEEDSYDHSVYLSKYDNKLKKLAKSQIPIHPDSRVTAFRNKLYVTSNNTKGDAPYILVFDKKNLQLLKKFSPTIQKRN